MSYYADLSELSGVIDDGMLSGAVESCSVMAPQHTLRRPLPPAQPAPPTAASDSHILNKCVVDLPLKCVADPPLKWPVLMSLHTLK